MKLPQTFTIVLMDAAIVVLLYGCVGSSKITNLSPAYLYGNPSVSIYKNPNVDFRPYQTFSVFPQSVMSEKTEMNDILEKQMLFFLRNQIESLGYMFVDLNQHPDFLATVDVSSKYETSYVPPQTVTSSQWVPGRTVTAYNTSSGTFNVNTYSSYSSNGWGNYSGSSTATTYIPGYMATQSFTRPGYTVGYYYPFAGVSIFDGKSLERVWLGEGVGQSDNGDVRISSQLVIRDVFLKFPSITPMASNPSSELFANALTLGFLINIFTYDGNNYIPTIMNIFERSPAPTAGLQKYDMILAVDGIPVVNKPLRDVLAAMGGSPGKVTRLDVWRTGQKLSVDVTRATIRYILDSNLKKK